MDWHKALVTPQPLLIVGDFANVFIVDMKLRHGANESMHRQE